MEQEKMIIAAAREMTMRIESLTKENLELRNGMKNLINKINKDSEFKLCIKNLINEIERTSINGGLNEDDLCTILSYILNLKKFVK